MTDPPIGVVIATRNRADSLARTLRQLTALPERPPVTVVDNASTDHTRTMVSVLFPEVTVLPLPANYGAVARNHGVAAAKTPYVAFCDDDSWWEPGALTRAADLMERHPRLGLIAARTCVGPGDEPDPLNTMLGESPLGTAADLPGRQVLGFLACASVVRRSAFLDAGGFHPVVFFAGEETLLAYDLSARGWGVSYCPEVTTHHHPDPSPRAGRDARLLRNALLTTWLRRSLPVVLRRTGGLAAEAVRDPAARRALREALARLPAVLRHRRPLPPYTEEAARRVEGGRHRAA